MSAAVRGYLLQFDRAQDLLDATETLVGRGYSRLEAYTPFPVPGLEQRLPPVRDAVAAWILIGAILGGLFGYGVQYYTAVIDYPLLVGGKPMHSWPAFIPVTFELAVLGGALAGFFGVLWSNGLPRLHHPLFDVPDFARASRDRFFLLIKADDPYFDNDYTRSEAATVSPAALYPLNLDEGE